LVETVRALEKAFKKMETNKKKKRPDRVSARVVVIMV
jgi:hypothetical protein